MHFPHKETADPGEIRCFILPDSSGEEEGSVFGNDFTATLTDYIEDNRSEKY